MGLQWILRVVFLVGAAAIAVDGLLSGSLPKALFLAAVFAILLEIKGSIDQFDSWFDKLEGALTGRLAAWLNKEGPSRGPIEDPLDAPDPAQ
jgi:hypothetical protein